MEPTQIKIENIAEFLSLYARVDRVDLIESESMYRIKLSNMPAGFWTKETHLRPGDRVRITITKEPAPDVLPR
jgi:hypothetical protein